MRRILTSITTSNRNSQLLIIVTVPVVFVVHYYCVLNKYKIELPRWRNCSLVTPLCLMASWSTRFRTYNVNPNTFSVRPKKDLGPRGVTRPLFRGGGLSFNFFYLLPLNTG
uniref:Uncharacterized protein n=1 Tax=Cacopsylla melanoneura TaxID=428564 RepID=A0A8D8WFS2_9HEMI